MENEKELSKKEWANSPDMKLPEIDHRAPNSIFCARTKHFACNTWGGGSTVNSA